LNLTWKIGEWWPKQQTSGSLYGAEKRYVGHSSVLGIPVFFGELTGGISRKCGVHPKCVFEWEHDAGSGTWATRFSDLAQIEYCQRMMRI
jgi:hypothetical protein